MGSVDEAKEAYETGLKLEPDNAQIKAAIKSLEEQQSQPNADFLGNLFSNPEFAKMAQDPEFLQKMQAFQTNPAAMFSDPKMMQFMTNLYGKQSEYLIEPKSVFCYIFLNNSIIWHKRITTNKNKLTMVVSIAPTTLFCDI